MTGAVPMTADVAQPIASGERLTLIDTIRGFALLGILLANFGPGPGDSIPGTDKIVQKGIDLLVESSFYPLYSFLFGLGFGVQLLRARSRGAGTVHLYVRRLLVLFLIGAAHAVLIWEGDILVNYALLGFWLLPLHRLPDRALVTVILLLTAFLFTQYRFTGPAPGDPAAQAASADLQLTQGMRDEAVSIASGARRVAKDRGGSWAENVSVRWTQFLTEVNNQVRWPRFLGSDILICFLIGLWVGRQRVFERAASLRSRFKVAVWLGLLVAVLGNAYESAGLDWGREARSITWEMAQLGVTVAYVSIITLAVTGGGRAGAVWSKLAPSGRMGLTNYLLQSVVGTALFYPYGLHLKGLGTTVGAVILIAFYFLVQVPLSRWWLARYRFGPAEWLWRSLTYGVRQPMRLTGG